MTATKENLQRLKQYIDETNESNSTNDKLVVLEKYKNDEFVTKILYYTHNDFLQFRITSKNLQKKSELVASVNPYGDDFFLLLDDLHASKITGHYAISIVNKFIEEHNEFADIIYNIIDRTLETRVTTSLINRVIPDFIPEFSCALCESYDDQKKKPDFTKEEWVESQKLDGCRGIGFVDSEGNAEIKSRSGKTFSTLSNVLKEIKRLGIKDVVLDGEICIIDEQGNDNFPAIMKEISKKDHTIEKPRYKLFDVLTHEEFMMKKSSVKLVDRLKRLENILNADAIEKAKTIHGHTIVEFLPQTLITSQDQFEQARASAANKGWEGLIVRKNAGYQGKRSKDILKVKNFFDAEYKVLDTVMEPMRHIVAQKEITSPMLKAVVIEHKGNRVDVGSGFSIEERLKYYDDPSLILGKVITVQYFEESTNQNGGISLRFPTVKTIHGEERTV